MNDDIVETDEWLQMNFPVGSGPSIIAGGDCHVSQDYYMKIEFSKNSDSAFFVINSTPEYRKGLRGVDEEPVISFSISRELLLKIVRTIAVSNDTKHNDDFNW
jgi:hypothetical protein